MNQYSYSEPEPFRNPPRLRSGTNDDWVWRSVVEGNEYFVPETLSAEDVIIDIGLHIGSFSYLVLTRGAGQVYGFEADDENYSLARANLQAFGERVVAVHGAVCRSDVHPSHLFFSGYEVFRNGVINTGGGNVFSADTGKPVRAIPFDSIVDSVTQSGHRRIRLLKLDCEGSEYPILMTSGRLDLIDEIVGEYHEIGCGKDHRDVPSVAQVGQATGLGGDILADCLARNGFAVRLGNKSLIWGKFLAWNRRSLPTAL